MSPIAMKKDADRKGRSAEVRVWDVAVRIFHWSLVASFIIAWISADEWDRVHELAGYVLAVLIGVRLIWGFIGSKHARFKDFIVAPSTLVSYVRDSIYHRAKRYLGHNPAGGAMIIALLVTLAVATGSGIASVSTTYWGVEWVEELHEISATLALILVILHVAGVIFSSISHRENLIKSMITGKKRQL